MALDQLCGRDTSDDVPTYRPPPKRARATPSRAAAAPLEREIKQLKMVDLEFGNQALTPDGEAADRSAPTRLKAAARGEAAERFRKGRRR